MAVKTLADGRTRWILLTTKPTDPNAVTLTEALAGLNVSCDVAKSGSRISATGSDSVSDPPLCSSTNAQAFGASNYEGSIAPFWYLDADGLYDSSDNAAMEAVKAKGTTLWLLEIEGPVATAETVAGEQYELFEVLTDNPQKPTETNTYVKRNVPLAVQQAWKGVIAAAG